MRNVADFVSKSADHSPAHVAIIEGTRRTTYVGLDSAVSALAAGLVAKGIAPGERVAILIGNRTEFAVAYYGILRAGAVAVPLNTGLTADEVRYGLEHVGARLLFADPDTFDVADEAKPGSVNLVCVGTSMWDNLLSTDPRSVDLPEVDRNSLAVLLFTAGSTGRPKGAMLSHRALIANTEALLALDNPPAMTSDDIVLGALPLFHIYSLNSVLGLAMAAGATLVMMDRFSASDSLQLIRKHRISVVAGAPPMYIAWSAEDGLREAMETVRLMSSGAAPLPSAVFEQFRTMAGQPIWEGYGLTECAPVVSTSLVSGRPMAGSVGRPLPNVEVRLVDEGGDPIEDAAGEVYVRADSLFNGYWPDAHDGPDENGWFATGDVAYLDEDGNLRLIDRRKELVLVSGFNVYPREVERVIHDYPGIAECAVIGVPHPYSGEAVKAFVTPLHGHEVTGEEILEHCRTRLARFKCPTIVEIVPELPHTAAGKVARGVLRSQAVQ